MPKNLSFNADINLSGDITDVGDVTANSFIGTVAPATETTLTATSNTAFLTAASHTLANGSVQGTRKLIVNDQVNPGSLTTELTINGSFRKSDGTTPSSQTLSNLGGTLDIVWDGTYWTVV